jgi:2'-5' RNA ligase
LPDDADAFVDAWVIVPPPELKRAVLRVQGALEDAPGLRIVPHHFLHVSLPHAHELEKLFEVSVARVNCFPAAVVAEVESETLDALDAPETFLPHLSLAYVERPVEPGPVRAIVEPLRDTVFGPFLVDEVVRVRVPAAKATILEPWTVAERLSLRR